MTKLISPHGGYENLKSFQMAQIVYDLNFQFCQKYVTSFKMKEQMEGAGRGGVQNIGEGSRTSGTSKQSELRLVNVSRASLDELKLDYEAYLRQRNLPQWNKEDVRALAVRKLAYVPNRTYTTYMSYLKSDEMAANCILCVINQANFLLDRQMKALESELAKQGDYKDRYKQVRKQQFLNQGPSDEEFLKEVGLKRLENGKVIKDE